ncbi:PilZ domain-containing protein [Falsibacillus pallidus]|uniref:PilZ domain-containing protein n=1 Tax=Falsibacillus pallidus TaxID=493781 RepID=A0A370GA15_9BACI|nr:PilZ domain-containing protein [Falsibacillus pallidus]RDI40026.1 PilZ domain-containing protein [Falsibacillus pallidus]
MRYQREEAFRYVFPKPLDAHFTIIEINGRPVSSSEGGAKLIDLSPSGMKLSTALHIPVSQSQKVKLSIRFSINDHEYTIISEMVWEEPHAGAYYYGVHFLADEPLQQEIISELKQYARTVRND